MEVGVMRVSPYSRKTFSLISVFLLTLSLSLAATLGTAQHRADAAPAQTNKEAAILFIAASQVGNGPVRGQYGGGGVAWCGMFAAWVMRRAGIPLPGSINKTYAVARSWAYYGAREGSYVRPGNVKDAMPGDLLIDRYNNTPNGGGHISIVIETNLMGDANRVRTIGGNESNRVRNQEKSLNAESRVLVTLPAMRFQTATLAEGGAVMFERKAAFIPVPEGGNRYAIMMQIKQIWRPDGTVLEGQGIIDAGYKLRYTHWLTKQTEYGDDPSVGIFTEGWRNIQLIKSNPDGSSSDQSTLTYN